MTAIQLTALFKIKPGNLEAFKKLSQSCIDTVKEKDSGTLQYDWFYSEDNSECHVRETYANSEALLEHAGNVGPYLGDLFAIADFSAKLYGNASNELKSALGVFEVEYYNFDKGL